MLRLATVLIERPAFVCAEGVVTEIGRDAKQPSLQIVGRAQSLIPQPPERFEREIIRLRRVTDESKDYLIDALIVLKKEGFERRRILLTSGAGPYLLSCHR